MLPAAHCACERTFGVPTAEEDEDEDEMFRRKQAFQDPSAPMGTIHLKKINIGRWSFMVLDRVS